MQRLGWKEGRPPEGLRKVRGAGEFCWREGIAFLPVVAESLGGLHPTVVEQVRRLARGMAMRTGEEEGTAFNHLLAKISVTLMGTVLNDPEQELNQRK